MNTFRVQVIIFVALGFLAGITGGLVVFNTVFLNMQSRDSVTVSREASSVVAGTAVDAERMGREMNQVVVEFYRPKIAAATTAGNVLLESDLLGRGSVITSDGWVLTHQSAFGGFDPRAVQLLHNGISADILTVIKDRATGFVLLKTSIKNIPSIKLGSLDYVHTGDAVAIGGARGEWRPASIVDVRRSFSRISRDVVHTSEEVYRLTTLTGLPTGNLNGAPVVSGRNELLGVLGETRFGLVMVPTDYINNLKDQIFSQQKIERPYFGVTYITLPQNTVRADQNLNQNGALVAADSTLGVPGVVAKSPAAVAGILPGDIITSINDDVINQQRTLSELLLPYKKGDMVEVKLLRNGQLITTKVTLGSLLTSTTAFAMVGQSK